MTYGEAINWIINISADIGKAEHRDLWHYEQALSEIREMLESAQPTQSNAVQHVESVESVGDCISRQAAMNAFAERVKRSNNSDFAAVPRWNDAVEIVENLPPVQPERKQGLWIDENGKPVGWSRDGTPCGWCKCSECGEWLVASDEYAVNGNYCPNCGLRMNKECIGMINK